MSTPRNGKSVTVTVWWIEIKKSNGRLVHLGHVIYTTNPLAHFSASSLVWNPIAGCTFLKWFIQPKRTAKWCSASWPGPGSTSARRNGNSSSKKSQVANRESWFGDEKDMSRLSKIWQESAKITHVCDLHLLTYKKPPRSRLSRSASQYRPNASENTRLIDKPQHTRPEKLKWTICLTRSWHFWVSWYPCEVQMLPASVWRARECSRHSCPWAPHNSPEFSRQISKRRIYWIKKKENRPHHDRVVDQPCRQASDWPWQESRGTSAQLRHQLDSIRWSIHYHWVGLCK